MKFYFDNCNLLSRTGPNVFAKRLAEQFYAKGHELVGPTDNYDVMLAFIEPTRIHRIGSKLVQRLDGIWFKPDEFAVKNVNIKNCYQNSDLVIWQSEFDKNMIVKWWGEPRKGVIIRNGIDLTPIKEITIAELANIRKKYDKVFVCSSNWHPQKRLLSNLQLFDHIRKNFYPNSCLIVMGSNPHPVVSDPHVFYTNNVPPEVYMQVYAMSNAMFHLAFLDHSPNVVCEALSQGTKVICSHEGGTRELVKDYGLILNEKKPYNFELLDYDNPPDIDVTQIGPNQIAQLESQVDYTPIAKELDIVEVASKYEKEIEKILCC